MQIKMTIDECLEFADDWAKGCTFHEGSQGWRVVCMLLAEEVRKLRGDEKPLTANAEIRGGEAVPLD